MKKLFFIFAALFAALLANAQEVFVFNADNSMGLDADYGTVLDEGTVIGQTKSIIAKIGAKDKYKPIITTFSVNGKDFSGGLQGATNPKDADGGVPAATLVQPVSGAFLVFEAKADGFLYVMHRASSNKAYTVFEEGVAISYTFAAIGDANTDLGAIYRFTLPYEVVNEQFVVKNSIEWAEKEFLKITAPSKYSEHWYKDETDNEVWNSIKVNGLGVIEFPVYAGCKYIVNANSSKITAAGFAFSTAEDVTIAYGGTTIIGKGSVQPSGGTIIADVDYSGVSEFTGWSQFDDSQTDGKVKVVPDGVAITVGIQTGQLWQPQVMVIPDGSFDLEEGGNYKVVVTAKFPTSGTLQINMGSWSANDQNVFPVTATGDFQEVECLFEDWSVDAEGAHLLFQCGDFKGTTILKKIQVVNLSGGSTNINCIIDNIYYKLNTIDKTATVTMNPSGYNGNIVIPETVKYEGEKYAVVKINDNAFSGSTNLTEVTIPYGVTNIGNNAFNRCEGLTSITIPNSVTNIGNYAFSYCYGLTSVTIPNSVTYIGPGAFEYCSGLTSITIPNSVTSIGAYTFEDCYSLTSIDIPNSVTSIGEYAFGWCEGLTSITIPNSVTSIGRNAFYDCYNLPSITIPNGVTNIEDFAFGWCSKLTSITIPKSVKSIGSGVLAGCSGLTSISVETGNPQYDSRNNCNAIIQTGSNTLVAGCMNTIIPNTVTDIREYAFNYCPGLTSIEIPNSVKRIGESSFLRCYGLTSITIPNSVTNIESDAFSYCSNLTSIVVKDGNKVYDSRANCNAIINSKTNELIVGCMNTIIPNTVTSIGSNAFHGCYNLFSIDIPNSVTNIEKSAFEECSNLTSVIIPSSVTNIGERAFSYCSSLTSVTIPNSVTSIGESAFSACTNLSSVVSEIINPFAISDYTFYYWNKDIYATAVLIVPVGTKSAYQSTQGWSKFQNIVEVGQGGIVGQVFEYDGINYKIGESNTVSVTSGNGRYSGDLVIPGEVPFNGFTYSVTGIEDNAFQYCNNLTSVNIGNGVTSIGKNAFYYCHQLGSITIPNSVTSICESAFNMCNLISIVSEIENPFAISDNVFYYYNDFYSTVSLLVPAGTKSAYQSLEGWKKFKNIVEVGEGGVVGQKFEAGGIYYKIGEKNTVSVTSGNVSYYGDVVIPAEAAFNGTMYTVTGIGGDAFNYCYGLTSVTIPNSVTKIEGWAFEYSSSLTSILIPNSVTSIGDGAFVYCSGLTSIEVENGNKVYDSRDNCNAIINSKSNALVAGCKNTVIPNSVTSIGYYSFGGCSDLNSIRIPNSVTSIGPFAFLSCSLTTITIPNSVTYLGESAFSGCGDLTSIMVETGNPMYDSRDNCNAIIETKTNTMVAGCKSSVIPNSVTSLGDNAFYGCVSLTSIDIPDNVKSIGRSAFGACTGLKSITIPNSVTIINDNTFWFCNNLTSIDIPNSVTYIGGWAFENCDRLTSVEIPSSVTNIGRYAFAYCRALKNVYCMAETVPVTEYDVFWECNTQNATLYVPSGCVQEYRSVDPWTTFGSILETGRADVNCDGKVDDQDRKDIVNHIMGDTPAIFNKIAADLNGDKKVNVADVVLIINMIK